MFSSVHSCMRRLAFSVFLLASVLLCGCAARSHSTLNVAGELQQRTGHSPATIESGTTGLPAQVKLEDGLSEDEAVAIALWNNPAFQTELTRLGIARADLADARFLRNPIFSLLFPLGPKQLESTISWPIEQIWLRPRRMKIAQKEIDRVSQVLVQSGLDLARDARLAHANALRAAQAQALTAERAALESEITGLMQARLRAGDISEREANQQALAAEEAREAAARTARDSALALEQLRALLGWSESGRPFSVSGEDPPSLPASRTEALLKDAFAARPDLRAAELAIEVAGERAKLEKAKIFTLTAMLDINAEGRRGFEAGPGIQAEVPLANWNQGGRSRARAELDAAMKRYIATRQRIAQEVRESVIRVEAARASAERWRAQILPRAEEQRAAAQKSYESGDVSYLAVLESARAVNILRERALEAQAEESKARADLERSLGHKLSPAK